MPTGNAVRTLATRCDDPASQGHLEAIRRESEKQTKVMYVYAFASVVAALAAVVWAVRK